MSVYTRPLLIQEPVHTDTGFNILHAIHAIEENCLVCKLFHFLKARLSLTVTSE